MEPELPTPRLSPEHNPAPAERAGERFPTENPEQMHGASAERFEQKSESGSRAADAATISLPQVNSAPATAGPVASPSSDLDNDMPLSAADDDLIEKEWVDKAKQIISKTKDDPYQREREISRLQVEYLKKRYGKELGSSS